MLTEWLITANENSNAIVNISGRQRMLSQRITLLNIKLSQAPDEISYHALQRQLTDDINLMEASHKILTKGDKGLNMPSDMPPDISALYYGPKSFVDRDVQRFIKFARAAAKIKYEQQTPDSENIQRVFRMSRASLLADLDNVVRQYQIEGEARVQELKSLGFASVVVFISALIALATSVFKPLVARVQKELAEKENTQRLLAASERRQRTIVESALDGVITINKEGRVVEFNPSALATFGYDDLSEVEGKRLEKLIIPHDVQHKHIDGMARFLAGGKSVILGKRIEVEGERRDGTIVPIELTVTSFRIAGEQYFTAFLRDLTDKKSADAEKKILEERLQQSQKMETMGTLAGGIAHDFNNILTPIVGYLQLLLRKAGDDQDLKTSLNRILKAANKATDLVGQILTFSRQASFEKKPISISPILKETMRLLQATTPSSINFVQKIEDDGPPILADPSRIQQVVMNLCTNAAHAVEDAKGTITVELETITFDEEQAKLYHNLDPGVHVKLVVSDTGKGMDEETQVKIFDPFFTTKRHAGGTGLGLATCHGIVTEMRGEILVESKLGEGTTFIIYFPTTEFAEESFNTEGAADLAGTGTVLLVDDVEDNVVLIKEMLDTLGYGAIGFHSSAEALQYFKNNPYKVDVVLTDQEMPEMTGDILAQAVKEIRPEIPIVLMTGFSEKISGKAPEDQGLSDIIQKPLTIESLGKSIKSAFHQAA
ncbi:MAG: ATP-binding protein [Rhodospirillales bacterium]|nr:ATP-binding protein [Rhodospirillales bacterium]